MHTIRVGTSGWMYDSWKEAFYPRDVPRSRWLGHLAERMNTVEINGTFYSLRSPDNFRGWAAQVPGDFEFAVKGSGFITHRKRLNDAESALANFFASGLLALGHRLGTVLWQLPARMKIDAVRLSTFLSLLPYSTKEVAEVARQHDERVPEVLLEADADRPLRHAMEFRHDSWYVPEVFDLLRDYGVGNTVSHSAGAFPMSEEPTADFVHVRLHGSERIYVGSYSDEQLDEWADRLRGWARDRDVNVYFDNDTDCAAPIDAERLIERLA